MHSISQQGLTRKCIAFQIMYKNRQPYKSVYFKKQQYYYEYCVICSNNLHAQTRIRNYVVDSGLKRHLILCMLALQPAVRPPSIRYMGSVFSHDKSDQLAMLGFGVLEKVYSQCHSLSSVHSFHSLTFNKGVNICDWICENPACMHIIARHTFHHHMMAKTRNSTLSKQV